MRTLCLFLLLIATLTPTFVYATPQTTLGADRMMNVEYKPQFKGKRIGLITNHTAVNGKMESTISLFKKQTQSGFFTLAALFAPEHGLTGSVYAGEVIQDEHDLDGIPIYSLHGKTRRPTAEMLKQVDVIVYDIQDIGSRSYTYISTLFYAMEECAKHNIPLIVLDRPNPLNGLIVDGPMMEEEHRSFLGYINIPYCHGMTVGELARFFNAEYRVGCQLTVIPMKGWFRSMAFSETGLPWIPTSPYMPEATTTYYYPTTGVLGELSLVNIGIGFTLPFKIVGAPWIDAIAFAKTLNAQKFPGVYFKPYYYTPFYGRYSKESCQGVLIIVTDPARYRPFSTGYLLMGVLKSLYPKKFNEAVQAVLPRKKNLIRILGSEQVYNILTKERNIVWKLRSLHDEQHAAFVEKRKKYLLYTTSELP